MQKDISVNPSQGSSNFNSMDALLKGKGISIRKINQIVSPTSGRIKLHPKGWTIRIFAIATLVSLIILYNYFGIINPKEQPIMVYTSLVISLSILVYVFGWMLYRNPSSVRSSLNSSTKGHADTSSLKRVVSVIIPIYNQKEMIEIVVDSIFNSTYKNIQVIAVNDGSTDGTGPILDSLKAGKYPQMKVIHKENRGKRKAVASGFNHCGGEYIILVDSDSVIDSNSIEEFVKVFDSNPAIGAAAGQAKIWNADNNLLTKCQDAWYDYEYNVYKTCESYFGTVTCCSGCLAGYRREAIENVISIWSSEDNDCHDKDKIKDISIDNNEKKIKGNKIKTLISSMLQAFRKKLLLSLLSYDDSEDRALTTFCLMKWKSVYIPTAIVYTDVPNRLKSFIRQQQRWKKGYLRANLFASTFFWAKNPVICLLFYAGLLMTIVSPVVTIAALCYGVFVLGEPLAPLSLMGGFLAIGFLEGFDYKMRDSNAKYWKYRPIMNLILSFVISWLIFYAIIHYRRNTWLTR